MRVAQVRRDTAETQIQVSLNLDGSGQRSLDSGLPFLDHMLDQIARHGLIDLDIAAKGDLQIDAHHTVEDIGITLGQAFAKAVGDKRGICRYGHAYVPLDEALSRVVVDLSGRPGLEFGVKWKRSVVGQFDLDLIHEFFRASSIMPRSRFILTISKAKTPITSARRFSRPSRAPCVWRWRSIRACRRTSFHRPREVSD